MSGRVDRPVVRALGGWRRLDAVLDGGAAALRSFFEVVLPYPFCLGRIS